MKNSKNTGIAKLLTRKKQAEKGGKSTGSAKPRDMYEPTYFAYISVGLIVAAAAVAGGLILSGRLIVSIVLACAILPYSVKEFRETYRSNRKRKVEKEFLEAMQLVLSDVSAGNTVEQAFVNLHEQYENGDSVKIDLIAADILKINRNAKMNYSFYDELQIFALKTKSEDILSCAKAVSIAGCKGGDMVYVIRNALANMRIKQETDDEVQRTLAMPKYNLRIITVMPFALVLLMRAVSKDYIETLYRSKVGSIVVAAAAAVIFLAWILGNKISSVKL